MATYCEVSETLLSKGGVFTYNSWSVEGKQEIQFEVNEWSKNNIWVKMLFPQDKKDGVERKRILKDKGDGVYFKFNNSGPFQRIYLSLLKKDKIIKK